MNFARHIVYHCTIGCTYNYSHDCAVLRLKTGRCFQHQFTTGILTILLVVFFSIAPIQLHTIFAGHHTTVHTPLYSCNSLPLYIVVWIWLLGFHIHHRLIQHVCVILAFESGSYGTPNTPWVLCIFRTQAKVMTFLPGYKLKQGQGIWKLPWMTGLIQWMLMDIQIFCMLRIGWY